MTPSPRVRLRRARPSDAEAIVELVTVCLGEYREFAPVGWEPPGPSDAVAHNEAALARSATGGTVATQQGTHVGHALWIPAAESERIATSDPATAYLWQLFLTPQMRGSGLASRLLTEAVSETEDRGYLEIRLLTPTDHRRARRFYEREGWSWLGDWGTDPQLGLELVQYGRRLHGASGHNGAP